MENKTVKIPAPKFEIGQIVYLKTDTEQLPRVLVEWGFKSTTGEIEYTLSQGVIISDHYDFEITEQKNYTL